MADYIAFERSGSVNIDWVAEISFKIKEVVHVLRALWREIIRL